MPGSWRACVFRGPLEHLCLCLSEAAHSLPLPASAGRGRPERSEGRVRGCARRKSSLKLRFPLPLTRLAPSALATLSPQTAGRGCRPTSPLVLIPFHASARWRRGDTCAEETRLVPALRSGGLLAETARQDPRQSLAEHPGVRGAVAVEHARFIEEKVRSILPEGQIVIAQRGERHDNVVPRVDLQDRLRRALDPPRAGQELLQLPVGAVFRSDQ